MTLRLLRLPLAAIATMAMLTGCGEATRITQPEGQALDTTPPPAPTGMAVRHDETGRSFITWEPSSAPDVVGYQVYVYSPSPERDNSYVIAEDHNSGDVIFHLPGADEVTTAVYRVRSVDAAGNRSALSTAVTTVIGPATGGPGNPYQIQ